MEPPGHPAPPPRAPSQRDGRATDPQKPAGAAHVERRPWASEGAARRRARAGRLLRKVDLHLLPFLVAMYLLNFLDRSNLAQARQGTLERDLGMAGTDFNLATSIFFVGYLLMQLPSNMIITRVRPSLYLSAAMTLWGVVSTCNAAAHSFGSLVAVRFILGFVEVSSVPVGTGRAQLVRARPEETRALKGVLLTPRRVRLPSSPGPSFS